MQTFANALANIITTGFDMIHLLFNVHNSYYMYIAYNRHKHLTCVSGEKPAEPCSSNCQSFELCGMELV